MLFNSSSNCSSCSSGIQAVGPIAAAITGAVEKLLQLLPNPLGRQACVLFNQTNQLIHTPPCGFKGVLSKIRPALLDRRQQAFKALTEVVLAVLPLDCGDGEAMKTVGRTL